MNTETLKRRALSILTHALESEDHEVALRGAAIVIRELGAPVERPAKAKKIRAVPAAPALEVPQVVPRRRTTKRIPQEASS